MDLKKAIAEVVDGRDLTLDEMFEAMNQIMSGEATSAQIGSFITALRMKGETVDEIVAAVQVMRAKVTPIPTSVNTEVDGVIVDTCGTGGDGAGTFNVSTAAAFVTAAAGVPVAKHGNRSVSSPCGSADVLEALGIPIDLTPEQVGQCIEKTGMGFLYAPALHGAMKYAAGPRRELGIRTIFNILGPLTNPARANVQLLGVFAEGLTKPLAEVLLKLGSKRALVVHGEGRLDEMTVTGKTKITELKNGDIRTYFVQPEEFGLKRHQFSDLKGGSSVAESALLLQHVLQGQEKGAKRDMVLLNGGGALYIAGRSKSIEDGVSFARELIDSGAAFRKLEELVSFSQSLAANREV